MIMNRLNSIANHIKRNVTTETCCIICGYTTGILAGSYTISKLSNYQSNSIWDNLPVLTTSSPIIGYIVGFPIGILISKSLPIMIRTLPIIIVPVTSAFLTTMFFEIFNNNDEIE